VLAGALRVGFQIPAEVFGVRVVEVVEVVEGSSIKDF
jgi:chemotaxis signal transduction protein